VQLRRFSRSSDSTSEHKDSPCKMNFKQRVLGYIAKVPKGKVVSYGQVAAAAGSPRAARQVGAILRGIDPIEGEIPWWRVINNQGFISIKGNWTAGKEMQKSLLEKDGVKVSDSFTLDINKYRF
jgi:methylated-DNA-protein-cysteine methyltransferase-like protein